MYLATLVTQADNRPSVGAIVGYHKGGSLVNSDQSNLNLNLIFLSPYIKAKDLYLKGA